MHHDKLKIHLINTRSLVKDARKIELTNLISNHNPDLVLVNETSLKPRYKFGINKYNLIRNDRLNERGGGTMIIFRESFDHSHLHLQHQMQTFEYTAIVLNCINNTKIIIITIYKSRHAIDTKELNILLEEAKKISQMIIMAGDYNAHHTEWHCKSTNSEGKKLLEWAQSNQLVIHSSVDPTRQDTRSASVIDLFIATPQVQRTGNHPLKTIPFDSDHNVVEFSMSLHSIVSFMHNKQYYDWQSADFNSINNDVKEFVTRNELPKNRNMTIQEIDDCIEGFTYALGNTVIKNVPTRKIVRGLMTTADEATKKFILQRKIWRKELFKIQRKIYRGQEPQEVAIPLTNAIRRISSIINQRMATIKRNSYIQRISSIRNGIRMHAEIKRISEYKNRTTVADQIVHDGASLSSDQEKSEAFADHYEKIHHQAYQRGDQENSAEIDEEMKRLYDHNAPNIIFSNETPALLADDGHNTDIFAFTEETIEIARNLNSKKSAAHDGIPNYLIKKLPFEAFVFLTILFNHCSNLSYFPTYWKMGTVNPILKTGKDASKTVSYRPVMLLSNLSKMLERLMKKRIERFVEDNQLLPDNQFGFRPGLSTNHAIYVATTSISKALNNKQPILALALDTEKAFDAVWHGGLIICLHQYGMPLEIVRMLYSYLKNRILSVQIGNSNSSWRKIWAGVPQGSVLSPLLYAIYIAAMPKPSEPDTQIISFADDQLLLAWGKDDRAEKRMNNLANKVYEFCSNWKIAINSAKSQLLKITGVKSRLPTQAKNWITKATVKINNIETEATKKLKYLGITINEQFSFNEHLNTVKSKARIISSQLNSVLRSKHVNTQVKSYIYKTILRPIITYGCNTWINISSAQIEQLRVFERKQIRMCHETRGRSAIEQFKYINSKHLYTVTGVTRIDRFAYFSSVAFLRGASQSANAEVMRANDSVSLPEDFYRLPYDLLRTFENGNDFDPEGNLIIFHKSSTGNGLVYAIGQDDTKPRWAM